MINMKMVLGKIDRNSSIPLGLGDWLLAFSLVSRFHRMLFKLIPLRGLIKRIKVAMKPAVAVPSLAMQGFMEGIKGSQLRRKSSCVISREYVNGNYVVSKSRRDLT